MKSPEGMYDESVVYVTKQGTQVRTDEGRIVIWNVDAKEDEQYRENQDDNWREERPASGTCQETADCPDCSEQAKSDEQPASNRVQHL